MPRTTSKIAVSAAATLAIVGAGAFGTFSAFSDTTDNKQNTFASGTLDIRDDDNGAFDDLTGKSMFSVSNIKPGDVMTRCINVKNAGSLQFKDVTLSLAATPQAAQTLADDLTISIERGTGAAGGDTQSCSGFTGGTALTTGTPKLNTLYGTNVNVDAAAWTAGAVKSYRFVVTLPETAGNEAQASSASFDAAWAASQIVDGAEQADGARNQ